MSDAAHAAWAVAFTIVGVAWAVSYCFAQIAKAPIVPNEPEKEDES